MLNFKTNLINVKSKRTSSEAYNIKEFILTALPYKYLYLASIYYCLAVAFMINKFSPTVIKVNS